MNAVVLAEGYLEGGREGARKCLAKFWRSISDAGSFSSAERKFLDIFFSTPLQSMATQWWADFFTYSSPYDFNSLNINPGHEQNGGDAIGFRAEPQRHAKTRIEN
jgi:NTE family protein